MILKNATTFIIILSFSFFRIAIFA
jgi:hypothetical protein